MNIEELAVKLRHYEDMAEINQLKSTYVRLVDKSLGSRDSADLDALMNLFVDDAVGDYGARLGLQTGKPAIRRLFAEMLPGSRVWFMHFVANPIIGIDGDKAKGEWTTMSLTVAKGREKEKPETVLGRYVDQFVRTREGWRISHLKFDMERNYML